MALCYECKKPCLLFPACPEHVDSLLESFERADLRVTQTLERVEAELAVRYRLALPCREALIERWRAGELHQPDNLLREWRKALLDYAIQCGGSET
jgi:hypothetical protein